MDKKVVVSLVIIFLMVTSVAGFIVGQQGSDSSQTFRYNDYVFKYDGQFFTTELDGEDAFFYFPPDTIALTPFPTEFIDDARLFQGFIFTRNQNDSLEESYAVMHFDLAQHIAVQGAYTEEGPLPVATCDGSTPTIFIYQGNESTSTYNDACLEIVATTPTDVALYRDAILYYWYGVLP
tara:strand:- start:2091 stop:2627 length:537 start_codon:yes stop_codon:yes gene_type:complete